MTEIEVGEIPIPVGSGMTIALILLQIFPNILYLTYTNPEWKTVAGTIINFRRIGAFVHHTGEPHYSRLTIHGDILPGGSIN